MFLYLASASPRRQELLKQVNIDFSCIPQNIDETIRQDEKPLDFIQRLAVEKSQSGLKMLQQMPDYQRAPVLGADTMIIFQGQAIGKPDSLDEAKSVLNLLSDNTHQVISAICLSVDDFYLTARQQSEVSFRKMSDAEINDYCHSKEPMDKAGSYAIQGQAAKFIKEIKGSFSGIMGLPLYELELLLQQINAR